MEARLRLTIPSHLVGERADKVVAELAGVSRQTARALFEQPVTIDGVMVTATHKVPEGVIEFAAPPPRAATVPEDIPFQVVFADQHLLVIDKPAGLVVHPGAGRSTGTLAAGLLHRFPELATVGEEGRAGLVHRLDQGTSGLLLVARDNDVYQALRSELRRRSIHRGYLALVHGTPSLPTGTVDAPIARDPAHPTKKKVMAGGRPSRTHYRVRETFGVASLLEVTLETGRTHQIRVHMAAIDHPVVGDRLYSRRPPPVPVSRMFLHAFRLELDHPVSGERLEIESPLPPDLEEALVELARLYPDRAVPS